ncbi:MAG: SDR family NAD(P)-dependent oxidoreductase [Gammaproteobacteria bacterium]|nr:SDR family NAD(P)-dependent oxidoreductase [Gammaproteobacteria bacterium]
MDTINNKTAIITGGSEGVGAATAGRFADAGANLVLVARGQEQLEAVAARLRVRTRVLVVPMDVTDAGACDRLLQKTLQTFGSVDILINNAGYHARGLVEEVSANDLGRMIDVNLKAPVLLSRMALPYLRESRDGAAIVNVASLAGRVALGGAATYSATKFALRVFTFALADELRGTNIKLGVVSPGPVDTGFIMSDIDAVTDVTFSQPISTASDVADEIFKLCLNDKLERAMPPSSGFITTLSYLFPSVARRVRPMLERKGQRTKQRLKAAMRSAE